MPIADLGAFKAELTAPYQTAVSAAGSANSSQPSFHSFWLQMQPTAGAIPGTTPVAPARTIAGAIGQQNSAGTQRLLQIAAQLAGGIANAAGGYLLLVDRLLHVGGLNATLTGGQATAMSGLLPARAGTGVGVFAALEVYQGIGATGTTATCTYTSSAGASQVSPAVAFGGSGGSTVGRVVPIPLAAGDVGVRSVDIVNLAATTGTAGNYGVTIYKPLFALPLVPWGNEPRVANGALGMCGNVPTIPTDACLAWMLGAPNGATGVLHALLSMGED